MNTKRIRAYVVAFKEPQAITHIQLETNADDETDVYEITTHSRTLAICASGRNAEAIIRLAKANGLPQLEII